jgi:HK97 family phage major capsid protein
MKTKRALQSERAGVWAQIAEFVEREKRGALSATDAMDWQRALDKHEDLQRQLKNAPDDPTPAGYDDVDQARSVDVRCDGESVRNTPFGRYLRTGSDHELRAQGTITGPAGGYAVPTSFRNTITETMKAFGGLRRLADVVTTDNGQDLPWPTNDDTGNAGGVQVENTEVGELDATLGEKELGAHMYTSKVTRVSRSLIDDAAFPFETWLARRLGQRIGRAQAPHWLTGLGMSNQPQGAITAATVGVTADSATAITYDELVDLTTSVDAAYLEEADAGVADAGVGWVFNQVTYGQIRKLKDSQLRPLIEPNLQTGRPTQLLGYPFVIDNGMANAATGTIPILFGNVKAGYVIRDVGSPEVLRFEERYGEYLQIGFLGYHRSDGLVQDSSAFKVMQMA